MNTKANSLVKPEGDLDLVINADADKKGALRKVQGYTQVGDNLLANILSAVLFDTTTDFDGGTHSSTAAVNGVLQLQGGLIQQTENDDNYKVYTTNWFSQSFIATGTSISKIALTVDKVVSPSVKLLVVGGGGAGADMNRDNELNKNWAGGGGGAGGYIYNAAYSIASGSYSVTVGTGGAGVNSGNSNNGTNSVFNDQTAVGGGRGGYNDNSSGGNGGSGGGGSGRTGGLAGGSGTSGQGYNGATGNSDGSYNGGGGGGAGSAGSGGTKGAGVSNSISGSAVTYSVGGEAGGAGSGLAGSGNSTYGSGGRGVNRDGDHTTSESGFGGIVIIRYVTANLGTCTGGTITTDGADTIHTFTTSGTFTVSGGAMTDLDVRVETDSSGKPSGSALTNGTATIDDELVTTSPAWHEADFSTYPTTVAGTKYWIVAKQTGGGSGSYYRMYKRNSDIYTSGQVYLSADSGTNWSTDPDGSTDATFKVYGSVATAGTWISSNITLSASQTMTLLTIKASNLSATSYISQVDIVDTSNAVQSSYTTDIVSGASITLRTSDLSFAYTNGNTFRVKLSLASSGTTSPLIDSVALDFTEQSIKLLTPFYQSSGTKTLVAGVAGTIKKLVNNQWVDVDTSLTSGYDIGAVISRASKNTIVKTATATAGASTSITDGNYLTHPNSMQGKFIKIIRGTGAGQVRVIQSNTGTTTSTTTSTTTTQSTSTSTTRSTSTTTTA